MAFRFEFDSVKTILVARFEGRVTEELLTHFYAAARKYAIATDADGTRLAAARIDSKLCKQAVLPLEPRY
jgi:hypothetical protein